jgi:hypothetical protein
MTVTPPGPHGTGYEPRPRGVFRVRQTAGQSGQQRRAPRTNWVLIAGLAVTAVVATAALAVGIIDLSRQSSALAQVTAPSTPVPSPTSAVLSPAADTADADHALCTVIAPLMAENDKLATDYAQLGDPGAPRRDAATPKFITDLQNWVTRIQPIVDQHQDVDPFLLRSLQRFVDDEKTLVAELRPGLLTDGQQQTWHDALAAYGAPLHLCYRTGVTW